ncbi:MAG: hypothetical protein JETT_2257 [Candidatus Jettenia ecosi]|uniref:Uncharacterized protein n=1 Tax=Candidatus Jettenia ecosi TaxID=2494326 RepID=A0A533QFP3_9BACT|nr:MAG: hypothetical protein JETT_2257 [Candidatus Jettenia ecosi]
MVIAEYTKLKLTGVYQIRSQEANKKADCGSHDLLQLAFCF